MADQRYFEDLREGDPIPELQKRPTTQQLVQWAAASGDFYQIHYDKDFATRTGLDGVIVHGALKHAWLCDLLYRLVAPAGRVKRVTLLLPGYGRPGAVLHPAWPRHQEIPRGRRGLPGDRDLGRKRGRQENDPRAAGS